MQKISSFLIGMVLISLITVMIVSFMGNLSEEYGVDYSNSSTLQNANRLENITSQMSVLENKTMSLKTDSSITDVLGSVFLNGYEVLKLTKTMFGYFFDMLTHSTDELNFEGASYVVGAIGLIVLIIIIIGIFLSVLLKVDL